MELIWAKNKSFDTFRAFDHFLSIPKRSHFIHQFEVFLLGMNIILSAKDKGCDLKKYFEFETIDEITYCWLFTSAAHDFGYPVESFENIIGKLSDLYSEFGLKKVSEQLNRIKIKNILELEPEFSKLLLPSPEPGEMITINDIGSIVFNEVCNSLEINDGDKNKINELQHQLITENNHGYVSAILLYKAIVQSMNEEGTHSTSWMHNAVKKAIAAVCLHSLTIDEAKDDSFFIKRISFHRNPYAFLLFLIDNIQDWNRSNFPDIGDKWAEYFLDRFSVDSSLITMNYRINHERWEDQDRIMVNKFLINKKKMLEMIIPHPEKMNITVRVNFASNIGEEFEPIVIII